MLKILEKSFFQRLFRRNFSVGGQKEAKALLQSRKLFLESL